MDRRIGIIASPVASRRDEMLPRTFAVLVAVAFPRGLVCYHCRPMTAIRSHENEGRNATHIDNRRRRGIGTSLRKLLPPVYPDLLLSDLKAPADLGKNEKFKAADLADLAQVEAICDGVDGILHFGGYSVEGPWDDDPAVQHHRRLQPVRGRAQEGRQARGVRVVEPCDRLLSAPSPDRHRCHARGPTAATASARCSAKRSARSMPTSTGSR